MNREKALRVLITLVLLYCNYLGFAQGTTNQGKEFWTAYMSHIEDNGASTMSLYITADENTDVTVEIANNAFAPIVKSVVPGQVTVIDIPRPAFIKDAGLYAKGIHITSLKKVAVFGHIYSSNVSGATLLLPVSVLGKSYYSINYTQVSNAISSAYSTFMVIATEDNTTVEITPSQKLTGGELPGEKFTLNLKKGDVYQGLSLYDLTNTQIRSVSSANGECKKIAVFSGSTKISIGCTTNAFTSDNLFQQVYPTASWGKSYITVPLKNRHYDIYRVFFSDPNTRLTINGNVIQKADYQAPFYYQFESQNTNNITADKPVQVVQYAVSQGMMPGNNCSYDANDIGDPEMIYLNPLEQTLDHVTLYSPHQFTILNNYVNVVIRTDKASTLKVDGVPYKDFSPIENNPEYSYAQIPLLTGSHVLNADEGFTAIAYGFGFNESYGYSAGTNLKNLNEYLAFTNLQGNNPQVNGCAGVDYKLKLTLPFKPSKIIWKFKDGSPPFIENNPVEISSGINNGQIIYTYQYYKDVNFTNGNYNITATVTNPLAVDECGSDEDIEFDFNIADYPQVAFSTGPNLCSANDVVIHDETIAATGTVTKVKIWYDYLNHPDNAETFDMNNFPADKNYHHQYQLSTADMDYTVHMEVYAGEASICNKGADKVVTIKGNPIASFEPVSPLCQNSGPVQLLANNNGFTGAGVFSGIGVNEGGVFNPAISGTGKFTITYIFTADNLCPVSFTRDIVVNPLPVIEADNNIQVLEGEGAIIQAKASGQGLTYLWEPATGLDNATVLNPLCLATDDITYRFTVITEAGCVAHHDIFVKVLKKPVIVNAFTPNGDGINDTWTIKYLDTYPGNTVDIYNRHGEKVYSSVGYASPWDGRYKGNVLPVGTYYYIINPKNGRKVISGNVTIVR